MAEEVAKLIAHPPQDEQERRKLLDAARELCMSLERPIDTMHRVFWSGEQLPMLQVAIDLGIFRHLAEQGKKESSVDEIAQATHADNQLVGRLLRYLSAFSFICPGSDGKYSANDTTRWLSTPGGVGGVKHYLMNITPCWLALPEWLASTGYKNPSDSAKTAFQVAHNMDVPIFSWRPSDMSRLKAFGDFMASQREGQRSWLDVFPLDRLRMRPDETNPAGEIMFVDVGGSVGHQCLALREVVGDGQMVLQDQDVVLAHADTAKLSAANVKPQVHNFFQPQPVVGATAYYLRNVMHDWPDDQCVVILQHLKDAMGSDSMVLIDDMVLSDDKPSWRQVQKDIQMMMVLAAMERSESQWRSLLHRAGLRIEDILTYDTVTGDSVIVAKPA